MAVDATWVPDGFSVVACGGLLEEMMHLGNVAYSCEARTVIWVVACEASEYAISVDTVSGEPFGEAGISSDVFGVRLCCQALVLDSDFARL